MGKGKPRHNNENQKKKLCNIMNGHCNSWDGYYTDNDGVKHPIYENSYPWCYGKNGDNCEGNIHDCTSRKYKYLASLSEKERQSIIEKYNLH